MLVIAVVVVVPLEVVMVVDVTLLTMEQGGAAVGASRMLRPVAKYSINASEAVCISSAPRCWSQMATTLSAQSEDSGLPCIGGFTAKGPGLLPPEGVPTGAPLYKMLLGVGRPLLPHTTAQFV
jgi:hypothetical protein